MKTRKLNAKIRIIVTMQNIIVRIIETMPNLIKEMMSRRNEINITRLKQETEVVSIKPVVEGGPPINNG
jgi:hypothetical protein